MSFPNIWTSQHFQRIYYLPLQRLNAFVLQSATRHQHILSYLWVYSYNSSKLTLALKMEVVCFSETLVCIYESTRRHSPEERHRHLHRRENLRSHTMPWNLGTKETGFYNSQQIIDTGPWSYNRSPALHPTYLHTLAPSTVQAPPFIASSISLSSSHHHHQWHYSPDRAWAFLTGFVTSNYHPVVIEKEKYQNK
jgi:hypothetical protein